MSALDDFKIELMSVNLYIRKIVTRTTCSVISVSAGHSTHNEDNLYLGQLLKIIVIGMVEDDDAFTGLYAKNPYNFKSFNLRSIILKPMEWLYLELHLKLKMEIQLYVTKPCFMGCINWSRRVEVSLKGKTRPRDMPCWHLISHLSLTMVITTLWCTMVKSN